MQLEDGSWLIKTQVLKYSDPFCLPTLDYETYYVKVEKDCTREEAVELAVQRAEEYARIKRKEVDYG